MTETRTLSSAALAVLEDVVNRALRLDPELLDRLGTLHGKTILLRLTEPAVDIYVLPSAAGLRLRDQHAAKADVTLEGPLSALLKARGAGGPDRAPVLPEGLSISGDIDLGQRFQGILTQFAPDLEEPLARVFGDVVAHKLGNLVRGLQTWARDTRETLARDAVEYLQEERRWLPASSEAQAFLGAVDTLRADADRLEQRVRRLQRTMA